MGKEHLTAAYGISSVEFAGIVDSNPERADSLAKEFNLPLFTQVEQAIHEIRPDAVDICTPTSSHRSLIELCAENHLHALCEKPLALTRADAEIIREVCRKSGIRVMVAQVLRFWPEYKFAIESVTKETFGPILSITCRRLSSLPAWNSWMMTPQGGGVAIDLQIHDMDFILRLLGRPFQIQAAGYLYKDVIVSIGNQLVYPSGIPVFTEASYSMPSSYPFRMYFQIECRDAVMEMDFWRPKEERLRVFPVKGNPFTPSLPRGNGYGEEIHYFTERLLDGQPFSECPLDESLMALYMCLASEQSCRSHVPVKFD